MNITDFLKTNEVGNNFEAELTISNRFTDENGEFLKFKVRAFSSSELSDITRRTGNGTVESSIEIVATATIEPNFKDIELQNKYGVHGATELVNKILLPGEMTALADEILRLSGYGFPIDKLVKEAKKH